jgi:mannose-6-phosphate isomerase-like protein (cupin superfamily)
MEGMAMTANPLTTARPVESFDYGTLGVVWRIESPQTEGRFSVVEHPIRPRTLAAPLHRHHNEDEYSYVLEGRLGALLGERVVEAGVGEWVLKPRGEWHTFWNAGETECRIIEVISPAGFENYFRELAEIFRAGGDAGPDPSRIGELAGRYGLDVEIASVPELCRRFDLWHPMA